MAFGRYLQLRRTGELEREPLRAECSDLSPSTAARSRLRGDLRLSRRRQCAHVVAQLRSERYATRLGMDRADHQPDATDQSTDRREIQRQREPGWMGQRVGGDLLRQVLSQHHQLELLDLRDSE